MTKYAVEIKPSMHILGMRKSSAGVSLGVSEWGLDTPYDGESDADFESQLFLELRFTSPESIESFIGQLRKAKALLKDSE